MRNFYTLFDSVYLSRDLVLYRSLFDFESPELLWIKSGRIKKEYCWKL